jgi:hypothetical protein
MGGVIEQQLAHRMGFAAFDPRGVGGLLIPVAVFKTDASINEQHDSTVKTTDHPVYQGIPVSDNARPDPDKLSVTAFFSSTAVRVDDSVIKLFGDSPGELREQMKTYQKKGLIWMVDTSLEVYENMMLESMGVPRSNKWKTAIEMTLHFKQVRKATISAFNAIAKPRTKVHGAQKALESKATEAATDALIEKTASAAALDLLTGS